MDTELSDLIRGEIARDGSISFERFMELALYHPQLGYYRRARETPRTGRRGDFYTSVSVGPLFGRLLARQFLEMWEKLGCPSAFWIVEQGAEEGQLAFDVLAWIRLEAQRFFAATTYELIEGDHSLRRRQKEKLAAVDLDRKAIWSEESSLANPRACGVFYSNELVDAFPVHRIWYQAGSWREFFVGLDKDGHFNWTGQKIENRELMAAIEELALPALDGYETEINLRARRWMAAAALAFERGYILTIDYGFPASVYYASFRRDGTLTAYRNHRRVSDILADPGSCDITAHVDFTSLARAGEAAGLNPGGFLDQQHFLTGIAARELSGNEGPQTGIADHVRAWQTLTDPNFLGARYQVLLQASNAPLELSGLRFARGKGLHDGPQK